MDIRYLNIPGELARALDALDTACADVSRAFPDPIVRQYSVKANDVPAVIAAVAANGFGANVVSRGEWAQATRAGVPNERMTREGIGKTTADLAAAARAAADGRPLRWIALESIEVIRPSLDDVFLTLTGRSLRDADESGGPSFDPDAPTSEGATA